MKNIILVLMILLSSSYLFGEDKHEHLEHEEHREDDDHHHSSAKAIGEGKAIESLDHEKGFKLSKEAIKTLDIRLKSIVSVDFEISNTTLVTSKNIKGIYRYRDGYFQFVAVKSIKKSKDRYLVNIDDYKFGDQIVTDGVELLRVADVYSTDKSEYGHSH